MPTEIIGMSEDVKMSEVVRWQFSGVTDNEANGKEHPPVVSKLTLYDYST